MSICIYIYYNILIFYTERNMSLDIFLFTFFNLIIQNTIKIRYIKLFTR